MKIETIETPNGRFYKRGAVTLPSVTTVTGWKDRAKWAAWAAASPANAAKSAAGLARGNRFHEAVEGFFAGKESDNAHLAIAMGEISKIKPIAVEEVLFSKKLGLAGRCDCLGEIDGQLTVVDFKTAERAKPEAWLSQYWLQTAAYSLMWREKKHTVSRMRLIIACDSGELQVLTQPLAAWVEPLKAAIAEYNAAH